MNRPDPFAQLVDVVVGRLREVTRPMLVGVGGGVAAGKSTLAADLATALRAHGVGAAVLCTDCFLLPNATLDARGLTTRKGFPESYDTGELARVLAALQAGAGYLDVPVYSHLTYDVEPGERVRIDVEPVVIVEGVNVFWPPVVDALDLGVYIDAHDRDMRDWYLTRFEGFCVAAQDDPTSFYRALAAMPPPDRRALADAVWSSINLVNLREHIAPARDRATYLYRKSADHSAAELRGR